MEGCSGADVVEVASDASRVVLEGELGSLVLLAAASRIGSARCRIERGCDCCSCAWSAAGSVVVTMVGCESAERGLRLLLGIKIVRLVVSSCVQSSTLAG